MVEITSLPLQVTLRTVVNESLSTALYVYVFMELEVTNKTIHFFFLEVTSKQLLHFVVRTNAMIIIF